MADEKEAFLKRWSRLKREQPADQPVEKQDAAPAALPPIETLTPESDFAGFMHPEVEDALRRVALKKLFGDPRFNVADPFEAYSGDWTGGEPISEELLATINRATSGLLQQPEKKETPETKQTLEEPSQAAEATPKEDDGAGRQDA